MSKYNFKSSGISIENARKKINEKNIIQEPIEKIGIKTPFELGSGDLFKMHTNLADQLTDNLKNLILTNHGERLGLYDFGANLREVLTEYNSDFQNDFEEQVEQRILDATSKWMPFINIKEISMAPEKNTINGLAVIAIKLVYKVINLDSLERELKIRLFVI
jgi:phage baseplate assembly protein W